MSNELLEQACRCAGLHGPEVQESRPSMVGDGEQSEMECKAMIDGFKMIWLCELRKHLVSLNIFATYGKATRN